MLLAIDVGNTQTHLGAFRATELVEHWRFRTVSGATGDEIGERIAGLLSLSGIETAEVDAICVSSVVPPLGGQYEAMAARYATMLTGMMIDIDNFKQINDTYGHLVGDRVLKQLSALLKREQRSVDIVARYGGEEFVVLLPETTNTESRNFAERILRRVATHDFGEPGNPVRVTISIGIASFPDERVSDGESLLRLADTHLYRAKTDGRNRFRD